MPSEHDPAIDRFTDEGIAEFVALGLQALSAEHARLLESCRVKCERGVPDTSRPGLGHHHELDAQKVVLAAVSDGYSRKHHVRVEGGEVPSPECPGRKFDFLISKREIVPGIKLFAGGEFTITGPLLACVEVKWEQDMARSATKSVWSDVQDVGMLARPTDSEVRLGVRHRV